MQTLTHSVQALSEEVRRALSTLRDRRLAFSVCLFAVLLLLAAQVPPRYPIEVGQEDGVGGDLPLVAGFWPPERDIHGTFRWTTERALIRLPGIGQRTLQVTLKLFPINEEVARRGPQAIELWASGQRVGELAVRPAGAIYRLLLPPPADLSGDQVIELRSTTFVPTGDERALGTTVDAIQIDGAGGLALLAWRSTLAWLVAAIVAWLALRRCGLGPEATQRILLAGLLLASLAALLDPPRFAFGGVPALRALALGWLLVLALTAAPAGLLLAGLAAALASAAGLAIDPQAESQALVAIQSVALILLLAAWLRPPAASLGSRLGVSIPPGAWRWLLVFALLVFALRYGGKIYPFAMPGDIGFHANRYADTVRGTVLLLSRNRGVDFPYPPALYLLLAPLSLLGSDRRVLLHLIGALLDALSPFLVYVIAARGRPENQQSHSGPNVGLVAAAIYSFSAAGFMITWWNFSTHTFAQFTHLLVITALLLLWRRPTTDHRPPTTEDRGWRMEDGTVDPFTPSPLHPFTPSSGLPLWSIVAGLILLQSLVYLGHFGFWMNMSLLGAIGLAALLLAIRRGGATWPAFWVLLISFAAAQAFAALFFYSGYAQLFRDQIEATRQGGLTGLAGRAPADRATLWRTLWDAGFRIHFGFFPLPLALGGLALLWNRRPPTTDHRPPTTGEGERGRGGEGEKLRMEDGGWRMDLDDQRSAVTHHVSRITFHASRFTLHVSRITFHVSRITFHISRTTQPWSR